MSSVTSQAFRSKSSSEVVNIPTHHDPKSGRHVVRWFDINQHFKSATGILNGKDAVLFLADDNLVNLAPARIAYHPGVVLEVLVPDTLGDSNDIETSCPQSQHSSTPPRYTPATSASQPIRDDHLPMSLPRTENNVSQEELQHLKQQTQEIQRQMEETLQRLQNSEQQTKQSIQHSEQQTRQQLQLQISDNLKMLQQLQEWVNAIDQGNHLSLDQITGEFTKRQLETLNHQMFIHDHIHALLGDCLRESSIPRLFIVLPKNPNVQGATSGFQVHFLCACGSHTMTKDSKGTHEVHMTNHAGYNLERPKEFFDKYGRYVLSMMYMIKYGAIGSGLVVPPQSRAVAKIQKNLPSTCNIQQLIDATISYLEEVARTTDNDMSAPSHWTLGDVEQEGLKWYLEINKGAHYPGDLYQLVTQEHSSWVCSEHQCEWTVQRLKDVAGTIGGTSTVRPRKLDISVASSAVTMEFLDILAKFSGIQPIKDKPSFTADCERFSLAIEVSQNVQEVVMTIKNLIDLAEGDTDFVQQCNLTKLKISHTPEAGDENRLTIILQQSPHLKELWIGSIDNRVLDIVNLVISVREKMLQNGKPTALQTFELMENGLVTLNFDREWDDANHITATLKFSQGSTKFDMDTRMVLQNGQSEDEGNWICNFFRQYGWSISSLNTATMFNDNLSRLLDNVTQTHGSKLTHLILCPFSITTTGLDAMDRVIKRSQSLDRLRLSLISLDDTSQMEMAELLLERCGARVNELWLYSDTVGPWLQQISNKFSTRSSLPLLDHLVVECVTKQDFPHESIPWLITMVSPLPQSKGTSQQAGKPLMTGLKRFKLSTVTLETQDWESLVNAFDFSVLLELTLYNTNFTQTQLDLMIDRISGTGASVVPLETLDLKETDLLASADKPSLKRRIQQVAPKVATIHGL